MNNPTFTINLDENNKIEFNLNGGTRGLQGEQGIPGISPIVTLEKEGNNLVISVTDVEGTKSETIVPGDMFKSTYDTNYNGIVDNAEKVNNHTVEIDVPANAVFTDTIYDDTDVKNDISILQTNKADKSTTYTRDEVDSLIPDVSSFITKNVNDLTYYTLKTSTGSLIDLEVNSSTYVVTLSLKDIDGNVISTDSIDLPLESVVVSGSFDSTNKKIVLTLQNGNTVDIPVGDLVAGLQTEITSSNKLNADYVDDTNSGNKFTNTTEKTTWNGKYEKPSGGIPSTDLSSAVQTSLGKADTALQSSALTDYVKNTDYATSSKGGVIRTDTEYNGVLTDQYGNLAPSIINYSTYLSKTNWYFISKGTLENVITGKGLVSNTDYATSSTGGVVKTNPSQNLTINTAGALYCSISTYNEYSTKDNTIFISKGTLENVLTNRIGAINSVLDTINGEVI